MLDALHERDAAKRRAADAEMWAAEHGRPFSGALLDGVNDVLSRVRATLRVPKGASVVEAAERAAEAVIALKMERHDTEHADAALATEQDAHEATLTRAEKATARALRAESSLSALRARVEALADTFKRIRLAATHGNPMEPQMAAGTMDEIDMLAKEGEAAARALASPGGSGEGRS
jgi:hypothetical protein